MALLQSNFAGGMSALFDSTKTPESKYRLGINCRVRRNGVEGSYQLISYNTPTGLHQAVFVNDNVIAVVVGGIVYKLDMDNGQVSPIGAPVALKSTAEYVYHCAVPAPNNFYIGSEKAYTPQVALTAQAIILQDAENQPLLVFSDFTSRLAGTYETWTYDTPEYVPIGCFMTSSGNKTFIVSKDRKRIYQSVSGRQLDFLLNVSKGKKVGNADTTYLSVSAAPLTAVEASQSGGLLASTKYAMYELYPDTTRDTVFGEIYLSPRNVFPVGTVSHLSYTFSNGETVFVAPAGFQSFNQVLQVQRASNNSPFGADVVDYLIRPVQVSAAITIADYTYIAAESVFGPAVFVRDNLIGCWVSIDLMPGTVKEFALAESNGLPRLFFITASGLYEMPLFSGPRNSAMIYIGEYNSGQGNVITRFSNVQLAFNAVKDSGNVTLEVYTDKELRGRFQQTLDAAGVKTLTETVPQNLPHGIDEIIEPMSFPLANTGSGYATGFLITIGADARLVSCAGAAEIATLPAGGNQPDLGVEELYIAGELAFDEELTGATVYDVTKGGNYVFSASAFAEFLNGNKTLVTPSALKALPFVAATDKIYCDAASSVFDATNVSKVIPDSGMFIIAGGLGGTSTPGPLKSILENRGLEYRAVLSPNECNSSSQALEFFSAYNGMRMQLVETTYVDFYLISFVLTPTQAEIDSSGNMAVTPVEMTPTGTHAEWLEATIADRKTLKKLSVVVTNLPPYSHGPRYAPGYAVLQSWPWRRMGVSAVFSAHETNYQRSFVDGVHFIIVGTGGAPTSNDDNVIAYDGRVKLTMTSTHIQGEFQDVDGKVRDKFTILA